MPNGEEIPPEIHEEDLGDGRVPGQVVMSVASAAADTGPPEFLSQLPVYGEVSPMAEGGAPTTTGLTDLDEALQSLNVSGLYRVYAGDPDAEAGAADASGGDEFAELASLVLVEFDPNQSVDEAIATLANVASVQEVTPSGRFSIAFIPDDPEFPSLWGMTDIRAPEAWDTTTGDSAITIAIVDTGCDLAHPDLAPFSDGRNFITAGTDPQDDQGHGTHVAGTIGALGNNASQVAGVAWGCWLLPIKVLDSSGFAVGSSIAQGIAWAASRSWIINCSLQGSVDDLAMRAAVIGARLRGVLVVAAMGNFGWTETKPSYPAAYAKDNDNVLAVGAVDQSHKRSVWSSTQSSNTGSWIGIAAPGSQILSTANGGGTTTKGGTSMAAPHVAGAAALVWSMDTGLTAQDVIATLQNAATPLVDSDSDPVPNSSYGYGLVDVGAAVFALTASPVGDFPVPTDDGTRVV